MDRITIVVTIAARSAWSASRRATVGVWERGTSSLRTLARRSRAGQEHGNVGPTLTLPARPTQDHAPGKLGRSERSERQVRRTHAGLVHPGRLALLSEPVSPDFGRFRVAESTSLASSPDEQDRG